MFGEEDEQFFPTIMRFADKWNGMIPRLAEGGKKQLSYVGEFYDHCGPLKIFFTITDMQKFEGNGLM
jgi:hypothetical protein